MSRFLESLKISEGKAYNLEYHQARIDQTARFFGFSGFCLKKLEESIVFPQKGLFKWRILYAETGVTFQEILPYTPKIISKFILTSAEKLDYSFKYADRSAFPSYNFEADTEPIFVRNGLLTDATFANLIFRKNGEWFTPKAPLLKGTQRQFLIDNHRISERNISVENLSEFQGFKLINAMMGMDSQEYPISLIGKA